MGRFDNIRSRVAELIEGSRDTEPEPQGYQGEERSSGLIRGGVLEHDPARNDLQYYRELYEQIGPIKSAIDNFASEVVEPGWYITADSADTAEQLTNYFRNVAILNTKTDVDAGVLMESMVREREIRGTSFIEKVKDDKNRHQALYPLQNDTITIYTKPGKAMLPAPSDKEAEPFDPDINQQRDQPPLNSDGQMGAYVQFDEIKPKWSNTEEVVYTRNEVIKWVRDADIGDPRGTSRIASSANRAEGLIEKLNDNDDAVKFKAWPQIIFQMGDEDNPWTREEVENFMRHYEEENMQPGLMQAVAGDVSVQEFAGETADIQETLMFDISMIMSGLPGPVFATGGFSQNVAPSVAEAQQRQFVKEVKKTRREMEELFTPYLRQVAEDYELDDPDSVELHVGRPRGEVAPEDIEGNIIRYTSDANKDDQEPASTGTDTGSNGGNEEDGDSDGGGGSVGASQAAPRPGDSSQSPQTGQTNQTNQSNTASSSPMAGFNRMEGSQSGGGRSFRGDGRSQSPGTEELGPVIDESVAELADPRLVQTSKLETELTGMLEDALLEVREEVANTFEQTADRPLRNSTGLSESATQAGQQAIEEQRMNARSRSVFEGTIDSVLDTLSQPNHRPQLDIDLSRRHRNRAQFLSSNLEDAFENAAEEIIEFAQVGTRQAVQHSERPARVSDRIRASWNEDKIGRRAQTIARVEIMSAVNALKLDEYRRVDEIRGVELINPCNEQTTQICQTLACDETHTAQFDAEQSLGEQFTDYVSDDMLYDGFDPLPTVPPYHFGCRTEIVPVVSDT